MNLSVSSELFGKQVKVDVWLTQRPPLADLRVEIERSLQTKAVLLRPKGGNYHHSLAIQLGALQVYDVASYKWVPLVDTEQVAHQAQLFAEVVECDQPSLLHIADQHQPHLPISPLTRLPQPKELPQKRSGSVRQGSPARHGSPLRSQSPGKIAALSTPRFVPPGSVQSVGGRASPARRSEVGTAWQPEASRTPFRGYHIADAAFSRQGGGGGSPLRGGSPVNCREESVQFPIGAEVVITGEREPLRGQRCRIAGHAAFGKVGVELGTGTVVSISATKLRVVEDGLCVLQGAKHDCDLSPHRSRSVATTAYSENPEGFLRDSLSSQAKVYSHTLAKHSSLITEERSRRESAETKAARLTHATASALFALSRNKVLRRGFWLWLRWLGHERWTLHKGHVSPRSVNTPTSPKGSPRFRQEMEEQLAGLRAIDQQVMEEEKAEFERCFNAKTEKLLRKLEQVQVEMESKEAEIYRERLVSASLRHRLKEEAGHDGNSHAEEDHPTPPDTPTHTDTQDVSMHQMHEEEEVQEVSEKSAPASPLALEMSEIQRQLAEAKMENMLIREENDKLRDSRHEAATIGSDTHDTHDDHSTVRHMERQLQQAEEKIGTLTEALGHSVGTAATEATEATHTTGQNTPAKTPPTLPFIRKINSIIIRRDEKEDKKETRGRATSAVHRVKHTNSPTTRRRSSSMAEDGKPVQAYQFPVGASIAFKDMSGATADGWVTNHIRGRVEVQGTDGKKHTMLPGRLKERQPTSSVSSIPHAPAGTPDTLRGDTMTVCFLSTRSGLSCEKIGG